MSPVTGARVQINSEKECHCTKWQTLKEAYHIGEVKVVEQLLENAERARLLGEKSLPNAVSCNHQDVETPLLYACRCGKFKADVNVTNCFNNTLLLLAARNRKEEYNCNISIKRKIGQLALNKACYGGNIDHGVDGDDNNNTPLCSALLAGTRLISEYDCDIIIFGMMVFHYAYCGDNISVVQTLILCDQADTCFDLQGRDSIFVLMLASYFEVAKLLFDNDAGADLITSNGTSALMLSQGTGEVELFQEYGVEVDTSSPQHKADDEARDHTTTSIIIMVSNNVKPQRVYARVIQDSHMFVCYNFSGATVIIMHQVQSQ